MKRVKNKLLYRKEWTYMFNIFNSKYNKALDMIETEIEDYREKEQQCADMINKATVAELVEMSQINTWMNVYRHKREALEDLKRHLEQYVC